MNVLMVKGITFNRTTFVQGGWDKNILTLWFEPDLLEPYDPETWTGDPDDPEPDDPEPDDPEPDDPEPDDPESDDPEPDDPEPGFHCQCLFLICNAALCVHIFCNIVLSPSCELKLKLYWPAFFEEYYH
jgi:hypothetical protein